MIQLHELTKRYGSVTAVDRLSFHVAPGRVTGFLGPNGAGKTTTMRVLLGLHRPTAGEARIDGRHYHELATPLRTVGALLDARHLNGGRTARAHLTGLARSNRIPTRRVEEVLELVGLSDVADRRTAGFSLGMTQRLGIAAALLGDPPVLVLDEPVNGLDPEGILWIRGLLRRLAGEGRTVFVSSHLMSEMALTADHLVVIGRGRLLADTSVRDFIARNSSSYVLVRTPEPERMREVLARAGVTTRADAQADGPAGALAAVGVEPETVGELAARHGLTVYEISPRTASLEEAFMRLANAGVPADARPGTEGR